MNQQLSSDNISLTISPQLKREYTFQKHPPNFHSVPVTNSYSMENSPVNQTQIAREYENRMRRLQNDSKIYKEQSDVNSLEIDYVNRKMSKQNLVHEYNTNINHTDSRNKNMSSSIFSNSAHQNVDPLLLSAQSKIERLTLRLQQKNLDFEQLLKKYESLEHEMDNLQGYVQDIEREKNFMAGKLRDIQIHTEGDEVAGQLQNKLVLMSTEVMRLGNINRNKNQQCGNLNYKIKKLEQQKQQLQRDILEHEKVIQEYRQKIRILQTQLKLVQGNLALSMSVNNNQKQEDFVLLQRQLDKANALIRNKSDVIDQLQRRNQQLERKNHDISHKNNLNIQQIRNEQEERIITLESEVSKYAKLLKSEQDQINNLEEKLDRCRKDKQKWIKQKERAQEQRNSWEYQFKECRTALEKVDLEFENYKRTTAAQFQRKSITLTKQEINKYEQRQHEVKIQMDRVTEKNNQLIKQLKQKEERFANVNQQFKRYEEKIIVLNKQIGQFKRIQSASQSQKNIDNEFNKKIAEYQEKIPLFSQQIQRVNYICEEYKHKVKNQESLINEIKNEMQRKSVEFKGNQKKYEIISKDNQFLKIELEKWKKAYEQLQKSQDQNVKRSINSQTQQLEYMKQQFEKAIQQNHNLQKVLTQSRSAKTIHQKQKQYYELEQHYRKKQAQLKDHHTQIQRRYEQKLSQMKIAQQRLYTELKKMKQAHFQDDNAIRELSHQIQRLNNMVAYKSDEILHQKKERELMQHNLKICQQALDKYKTENYNNQELEQRVRRITFEQQQKLEMYQNQHKKVQSQLKQKAKALRQLENRYIQSSHQKDILQSELLQKQRQIHQKYAQAMQMRSHQDVLQAVNQVRQSNTRLEQSIYMIQKQWIQKVENKDRQILELKNQVSTLRFKQSQTSIQQGSQVQLLKKQMEKCYKQLSEKEQSKQHQVRSIRIEYEKIRQEQFGKIEALQYKLNQYDNALKAISNHAETVKTEVKNKEKQIDHQMNINKRVQHNIRQIRQENNNLKIAIQSKQREIQQIQRKIYQYQGLQQKLALIGMQSQQAIERMKKSYHDSQKDKEKYQNQVRKLQVEIYEIKSINSKSSQKVIRFEQQKRNIQQQNGELKRQILHQRETSSEYLKKLEKAIKAKDQYQIRLVQMSKQLQRLTKILSLQKHGSQETLQKLQRQLMSLQGQKQFELRRIQDKNIQKVEVLSRQIERLNQVIQQNVQALRSNQIKQSQQKEQIERNTKQYYQRELILFRERMQEERRQMRIQQNSIIKTHNQLKVQFDNVIQQREALKHENIRVISDTRKMADQFNRIQTENYRLQEQSKRGFTDYQRYSTEINNLKLVNQNLQTKVITLQDIQLVANQNQKLIRILKSESKQNAEKLRNILSQNSKIVTEIGQFRRQNNNIKRLYQEQVYKTKMKDRQLQDLRIQQNLRFPSFNQNSAKEQDFSVQRSKLMERIRMLQKTKGQYEQRLVLTAQEVQRLSVVVQTKTEQQISLRQLFENRQRGSIILQNQASRKIFLPVQGIQTNQMIFKYQELEKQFKKMRMHLQATQNVNKNLLAQSKSLKQRNAEFELRYSKLKIEFQILDKLVHQYKDENHKLKNKVKVIERGQGPNSRASSGKVLNKVFSKPQLINQEYQSPFNSPLNDEINNQNIARHNQQLNVHQLIEEIDRINSINQDLKNQVADLRLQASNNFSTRQRLDQSLAIMVMTFAEVESLRNRVKHLENEKEQSRNSSLDAVRRR